MILRLFAVVAIVAAGCGDKEAEPSSGPVAAEPPAKTEKPSQVAKAETPPEPDLLTQVPECKEYSDRLAKYLECDGVPDQAREAIEQGLEYLHSEWAKVTDDDRDAKKKSLASKCKTAADALKSGAESMGCSL